METTTVTNSVIIGIKGETETHELKIECFNVPKQEEEQFPHLEEAFNNISTSLISKK